MHRRGSAMNPFSRCSRFIDTVADCATITFRTQVPIMALSPRSSRSAENAAWIDVGREIVAYSRVSSDEQRIHGLGLEAQAVAIEEYAARTGSRILARYREVVTGRRDTLRDRPELRKALNHAKRSGALLVFARWDRLAQNVSVTAQLLESAIDFVACDNPYANRLTIHILSAMAEYESQIKSERIKGVFALMKSRGFVFPPGKFTKEAQALGTQRATEVIRARTKAIYADLLPLIVSLRSRGYTLAEVASQLNGLGHRNQRHHPWTRENVWNLLRREGLKELASRRVSCRQNVGELMQIRARQAYAPVIPIAVNFYQQGRSTGYIAGELNRRGYKTTAWNPWTTVTVVSLIRREGIEIRRPTREDLLRRMRLAIRRSTINRVARTRAAALKAYPIAHKLRRKGKTYEQIAIALNGRRLRSSNGGLWTKGKVWVMLSRRSNSRLTA
jgi:DNA invertase Pin-like site-specific DNA recombinase